MGGKTISHCRENQFASFSVAASPPEIPGGWKSSSSSPLSLKAAIRSSSNEDVQASVAAAVSPRWAGRTASHFFPLSFQRNHQHGMLDTHIRSRALHIGYEAGFSLKARMQPCRREKQAILCNKSGGG